jgi:hypothetical protein
MTITSYPWSNQATFTAEWSTMARIWRTSGVIEGIGNSLEPYADATGMLVKVKSGDAWLKGHYFSSDDVESLVISAAHASLGRIDTVVLRVNWIAEKITLAVVTGTPATSPPAPALQYTSDTFELALGYVTVDATVVTIQAAKVTDARYYSVPEGFDTLLGLILAL